MSQPGNVSITSCILEHSHGVTELWVRCVAEPHFTVYEPIGLQALSGTGHVKLYPHRITDAFALEQWTERYPQVLEEGRTTDGES